MSVPSPPSTGRSKSLIRSIAQLIALSRYSVECASEVVLDLVMLLDFALLLVLFIRSFHICITYGSTNPNTSSTSSSVMATERLSPPSRLDSDNTRLTRPGMYSTSFSLLVLAGTTPVALAASSAVPRCLWRTSLAWRSSSNTCDSSSC